jgi:two-component system chemotaxis sensor kinase CheA
MADDTDALWREFGAETQEHLEALVWLLSDRAGSSWTGEEIARAFRYFHSLKGACLAMGFVNLEALAHGAEDILSLVRDGIAELDASLAALLLRTVDRLIDLRERAVAERRDAERQADLLVELERQRAAHALVAGETSASPAPALPLGSDPEMLTIYSEILEQRLPFLAGALADDPAVRVEAAETAAELAQGAEIMGFEALATDLQALVPLAADPSTRPALLALLDELRQQAALIEEITGAASGAARLADALAGSLAGDALASLDALEAALVRADGTAPACARSARAVFGAFGQDRAGQLLLLLEEQSSLSPALSELSLALVATLRAAGGDVAPDSAEAIRTRWQAALAGPAASCGPAATALGFPLRAEVLATLSASQRARLDHAFAEGGQHAYELLLELEGDPEIAESLMDWLASAVETITSRTVLRNGTSGFEFLILSPQPIEWLATRLESLDPDRHCLVDLHEAARSTSAPAERPAPVLPSLLRVRSEAVDSLMTEIGEIRGLLAGLGEILRHSSLARATQSLRRITSELDPALAGALGPVLDGAADDLQALLEIEEGLGRAHRRVWEAGLALRVVPIEPLFARVARSVRDLAGKLGKAVDLVVEGRDVRIDKSMIDLLVDPLMHIVRNALDHGIESAERRAASGKPARARLHLAAQERTHGIRITIADDGRGLDRELILAKAIERSLVAAAEAASLGESEIHALIFRPGFSTASVVTEISGRGVGLDVVAAALQRVGGSCDVETEPGRGTRFILKLPASAALVRALLVRVDGETLALPDRHVAAVIEREPGALVPGVVVHDGHTIPLRHLGLLLGLAGAEPSPDEPARIVIVEAGARRLGLIVDQFLRFQDLFLKELSPLLASLPAIGGAAVLGDGMPVLVLDADGIMDVAGAGRSRR